MAWTEAEMAVMVHIKKSLRRIAIHFEGGGFKPGDKD